MLGLCSRRSGWPCVQKGATLDILLIGSAEHASIPLIHPRSDLHDSTGMVCDTLMTESEYSENVDAQQKLIYTHMCVCVSYTHMRLCHRRMCVSDA